jgi:predicted nucleic acid-binding protein
MTKLCLFILLMAALLWSCNQSMNFDSAKWKMKEDIEYPFRNKMVGDLTKNHKLVGLRYSQVVELLGDPQYQDSSRISYQVLHDYGSDIDPIHTKYLNLALSIDSIVTSFKVDEWRK